MDTEAKLVIAIDRAVYDKVAALKACLAFQDKCHASLEKDGEANLRAVLSPKGASIDFAELEKYFRDELVDQQVRLENERLFSGIRQMIVEQAFRPAKFEELRSKLNR